MRPFQNSSRVHMGRLSGSSRSALPPCATVQASVDRRACHSAGVLQPHAAVDSFRACVGLFVWWQVSGIWLQRVDVVFEGDWHSAPHIQRLGCNTGIPQSLVRYGTELTLQATLTSQGLSLLTATMKCSADRLHGVRAEMVCMIMPKRQTSMKKKPL